MQHKRRIEQGGAQRCYCVVDGGQTSVPVLVDWRGLEGLELRRFTCRLRARANIYRVLERDEGLIFHEGMD